MPMSGPPLHPQLPVQSNPCPHIKVVQQFEMKILPKYCISPAECNEIQLLSTRTINPTFFPIIIENEEENSSQDRNLIQGSIEKH